MAKKKQRASTTKKSAEPEDKRKYRNFPKHTLEEALVLAQKIQDEMGGKPMNRLLLADAIGISPSSTNFRDLLSSAYKYGLTEGTEKADSISLTPIGLAATQQNDQSSRLRALRSASLKPLIFGQLFRDYANKKMPSLEMLPKILRTQYEVPGELTGECAGAIQANGRFVDIVRDIGGSAHILLDVESSAAESTDVDADQGSEASGAAAQNLPRPDATPTSAQAPDTSTHRSSQTESRAPKPIFVGHGRNKTPLQQLQKLLTTFQIPHKVVIDEPNLGRPIPQKVRDAIVECGSAILIFTRDEKLFDENGTEVWRPSENVVHELGAASFSYGDRIVIFKEKGLNFPTNFQSIGYIEFDSDDLQARTADLLKELIGFGLVKVTTT